MKDGALRNEKLYLEHLGSWHSDKQFHTKDRRVKLLWSYVRRGGNRSFREQERGVCLGKAITCLAKELKG